MGTLILMLLALANGFIVPWYCWVIWAVTLMITTSVAILKEKEIID